MTAEYKQIDCTIDIVTPENIAFQYAVAGPFRRLPALLMDICIRFAVLLGGLVLMGITVGFLGVSGELLFAVWLLVWFGLEWFYGGLLETFWNGQTVGKRLMGIRVLSVDGQPINGLQAVMRNILRTVDLMPLIPLTAWLGEEGPWLLPTCLLGLVAMVLNRRFQRLGDLVCGTMVVVDDRSRMLRPVRLQDPRAFELAAELPTHFQVAGKLAQALAAYAERRPYLSKSRREEIAQHLAAPLIKRLELPPDTSHDLLLCALYYRTFVVDRSAADSEQTGPSQLLRQPNRQGLSSVVTR